MGDRWGESILLEGTLNNERISVSGGKGLAAAGATGAGVGAVVGLRLEAAVTFQAGAAGSSRAAAG